MVCDTVYDSGYKFISLQKYIIKSHLPIPFFFNRTQTLKGLH